MKAAIWQGGTNFRIEDIPKPQVKNNEVLVRVKSVGICGSELHAYEGVSERRKPPLVMGHEFSGEVIEIGKDVQNLQSSDRIVVDPITHCGVCEQCLRGQGNVCHNVSLIGLHTSGAFAEYVPAPAINCYKLPNDVSFEEGSMVEPLSVAIRAINRSPVIVGDTVAIIGAGIIGLMALQAAKTAGAGRIFVTDTLDYRLNLAKKLGANFTVNAKVDDPVESIKKATDGRGVDTVLEAVGLEITVQQAIKMANIGGKVTIIGMLAKTMTVDILSTVVKELSVKGSYAYTPDDFRRAYNFIKDRKVDVKPLITNILPLDEVRKGFELLHEKKEGVLKVLLKP